MIKSARQRAVSAKQALQLRAAEEAATGLDRTTWAELADRVELEIAEYDDLVGGRRQVFNLCSMDDLGEALVKARLARGWTQRHLAELLGVSEQMVQKDERTAYENAGTARLADVIDALGYEWFGRLEPVGFRHPVVVNGPTAAGVQPFVQVVELVTR